MAKNRVTELQGQYYENARGELHSNQAQQKDECEQAHIKQYQEFNQQWDEDLLQTQKEDAQALGELEDRHTQQIEGNRQTLEEKLPLTFKFSSVLLDQQKVQANLAKQKKYQEAHDVQQKCQQLEATEREKYMKERHQKIIASEAKLIQKQQNEMNALKKKLEGNLNERLKLREVEHNKLLQRYQNVKKEIENQQKQEMNKFEKTHANWANKANVAQMRPGTATQRSVMGSRMQASRMTHQKSTYKANGGSQFGSKMTGLANPVGGPASKPSYMK